MGETPFVNTSPPSGASPELPQQRKAEQDARRHVVHRRASGTFEERNEKDVDVIWRKKPSTLGVSIFSIIR